MQLIVTKAEWDKQWQDGFREGCNSTESNDVKAKIIKLRDEYKRLKYSPSVSQETVNGVAVSVIDYILDQFYPESPQHDSSDL